MSLLVQIQFCTNCHYHNSSTRHDQAKYIYYFQRLFEKIKIMAEKEGLDINVMERERPFDLVPVSQTVQDNKCFNTENKRLQYFPKIGAFEVYVNHLLISSKIKSNKWPMVEAVAKKIIQMSKKHQRGQSILDYELGISDLKKSGLIQKKNKVTAPPKYELASLFRIRKQQKNISNFYQNVIRLSKTIQLKKDAFYEADIQRVQENYKTFDRRSLNKNKNKKMVDINNFMSYEGKNNQKIQQLPQVIYNAKKEAHDTKLFDYKPETSNSNRRKKVQRLSQIRQIKKQDSVQRLLKIYDEQQELEFINSNEKKTHNPQKYQNELHLQKNQKQLKMSNRRKLKDPLDSNNINNIHQINAKFNQTDLTFSKGEQVKQSSHIVKDDKLKVKQTQKTPKKQENEKRREIQEKILQQWFDNEMNEANRIQLQELDAHCLQEEKNFIIQDEKQQHKDQKKQKEIQKDQISIEKSDQKKQKTSPLPPKLNAYQPKPQDPAQYIKQKKRRDALKSLKEEKKISEQCESVHYIQNTISQNSSYLQVQSTSNQNASGKKRTKDDLQTQKNNVKQQNLKRPHTKQQNRQKTQQKIYQKQKNVIQEKEQNLQYSISITDSNFRQWDVKDFQTEKKKQGIYIQPIKNGKQQKIQQKKMTENNKTEKEIKQNQNVNINMTDSLTIPKREKKNIEVAHIIDEQITQGDVQEQQRDSQIKNKPVKIIQSVEQKKQMSVQNKATTNKANIIENQIIKDQSQTKIEKQDKTPVQYKKNLETQVQVLPQSKQANLFERKEQKKEKSEINKIQVKQQSKQNNHNEKNQVKSQSISKIQEEKTKNEKENEVKNINELNKPQQAKIDDKINKNLDKKIQSSYVSNNQKSVQWNAKYIQKQFNLIRQNQVIQTKNMESKTQKQEINSIQSKGKIDQKRNQNKNEIKVENIIKWEAFYDYQKKIFSMKGQKQKVQQLPKQIPKLQAKTQVISKLQKFIQEQKQPKKQKNQIRWNAQYLQHKFNLSHQVQQQKKSQDKQKVKEKQKEKVKNQGQKKINPEKQKILPQKIVQTIPKNQKIQQKIPQNKNKEQILVIERQLTITEISANFTKDFDSFGKMDPYIEFIIGKNIYKTQMAQDQGKTPKWTTTFTISYLHETQIQVKSYDVDITQNQYMGTGKIDLKNLKASGEQSIQINDQKGSIGTVTFKYQLKNITAKSSQKQKQSENQMNLIQITKIKGNLTQDGNDIYFKIKVGQDQQVTSPLSRAQRDFVLEQNIKFYVGSMQKQINFFIYDKDVITDDDYLTSGKLNIEGLISGEKTIIIQRERIGTVIVTLNIKKVQARFITLTNIQLKTLQSHDTFGKQQPYITARIGRQSKRTQTLSGQVVGVKNSLDFKYSVEEKIIFQVWEQDVTSDQKLSEQTINLSDLQGLKGNKIINLTKKDGNEQKDIGTLSFIYQHKNPKALQQKDATEKINEIYPNNFNQESNQKKLQILNPEKGGKIQQSPDNKIKIQAQVNNNTKSNTYPSSNNNKSNIVNPNQIQNINSGNVTV